MPERASRIEFVRETTQKINTLMDEHSKPKIVNGKAMITSAYGASNNFSIPEKLYSEVEDFFNLIIENAKKYNISDTKSILVGIGLASGKLETQGARFVKKWLNSATQKQIERLVQALSDHVSFYSSGSHFSKDHFFEWMKKKEYDSILKKIKSPAASTKRKQAAKGLQSLEDTSYGKAPAEGAQKPEGGKPARVRAVKKPSGGARRHDPSVSESNTRGIRERRPGRNIRWGIKWFELRTKK